jgi:predicted transcriptional regulator
MNKDLLLIDHINYLSDKRSEDQMNKLKELSIKTDKIFKEMHSRRIAQRRIKKIIKVWKKL